MSKEMNIAMRVKALKTGKFFMVATEKQRQEVCRAAKLLKDAGVIEFDVVTKREGDAFKVAAI